MLKKGDQAPEFELEDDQGNKVTLSGLLSDGPIILYFYPADFTPICTAEACSIRDMHEEILDVDIRIIGVSPQSVSSHARFRDQFNLPFPLLFDENKKAIRAYGVDGMFGIGVRRATYLIDESGKIENMVVSDLFVSSHEKFIKQVIADRSE
jgi:peroxiredoxin Q/BCP